jgi:hypothetical protein
MYSVVLPSRKGTPLWHEQKHLKAHLPVDALWCQQDLALSID